MSSDSHIPVLPTNLGEHGNFISKCLDPTGKIDPDAKTAVKTSIDLPKMKHKPTKEEETSALGFSFFSNTSLTIIILVFVIVLLILAVVWLVLKYNILKKDFDSVTKQAQVLEEQDKEMKDMMQNARQQMFMYKNMASEQHSAPQKSVHFAAEVTELSTDDSSQLASSSEDSKLDENTPKHQNLKEEMEATLNKLKSM